MGDSRSPAARQLQVLLDRVTPYPGPRWAALGGLVCVRAVRFLGRLQAKAYDQETRDRWWGELREELRAHAAQLSCTQVMGYRETVHIAGDAAVLSVIGTAVRLRNAPSVALAAAVRAHAAAASVGAESSRTMSTCSAVVTSASLRAPPAAPPTKGTRPAQPDDAWPPADATRPRSE